MPVSCNPGYYGEDCKRPCPLNCLENVCDVIGGTCGNCSHGWKGSYCDIREYDILKENLYNQTLVLIILLCTPMLVFIPILPMSVCFIPCRQVIDYFDSKSVAQDLCNSYVFKVDLQSDFIKAVFSIQPRLLQRSKECRGHYFTICHASSQ